MVQEKDVDIYLKARRDRLAIDILQMLSLVSLMALIMLEATSTDHGYTVLLAAMAAAVGESRGHLTWCTSAERSSRTVYLPDRTLGIEVPAVHKGTAAAMPGSSGAGKDSMVTAASYFRQSASMTSSTRVHRC